MYTENIAFELANWPLGTGEFILLIEMTFRISSTVTSKSHLTE